LPHAPTNHILLKKTRVSGLSYDIKIWKELSSVLSQSTRLTDERTDGQLSPDENALH